MHKTMVYLKGFAKGKQYWNMLKAIQLAIELHESQIRKSGEPYVEHPMMVAAELVALGIHDEDTLTAAVLHDVQEDCGVTFGNLVTDYQINKEAVELVGMMTKDKDYDNKVYYSNGQKDVRFIMIKAADRFHNISTMTGAFSIEKMQKYIRETEEFVIPMCKYGINHYPEYSDVITVLRINIQSMLKCLKWFLETMKVNNQ